MKRWLRSLSSIRPDLGLLESADFRKLWGSFTITTFGSQVTNLALPLTAALLLHATPWQMGVLVALEVLPFGLLGLFAGVWIDRGSKLRIVILSELGRGCALLIIPLAAFTDWLSIPLLYVAGFAMGAGNAVGGAAAQVLMAQMVGRDKLIEANAKIVLGENAAQLTGPGIAGWLIQVFTAPFAILIDAMSFFGSALLLRGIKSDPPAPMAGENNLWREIGEGLKLVWHNRVLRSLAWTIAIWQLLHHMQAAILILFATRDLQLSPGMIGAAFVFAGLGCFAAALCAERLGERYGVGPMIVYGFVGTGIAWVVIALNRSTGWPAAFVFGAALFVFDFSATLFGIHYMSLRQAITPDHLLGRMTATMRFLALVAAPFGALFGGALGEWLGLSGTLLVVGVFGLALAALAMGQSNVRQVRELPHPVTMG
ncbi:MAG: MFS transporter [Casimicrobiaceae bacterium]